MNHDDEAKLKALREAAQVGIADMEVGRYYTFDTAAAIRAHLKSLAMAVLAENDPTTPN